MSDSEKSNDNDNENNQVVKPIKKVVPPEMPLEWTKMGDAAGEAAPIRYPEDVDDISPEELDICIVGTAGQKITVMSDDFYKQCNPDLEKLVLRSHLIKYIKGIQGFANLELLELYDNQLQELNCLEVPGPNLRVLDMSYNAIRDMSPVSVCVNLTELCKNEKRL
jgi:Leucine-rich repeat (LRR) protein